MLQNASVLIVDDEEIMREVLDSLLTTRGLSPCALSASGEERAIELAKTDSFDVAVVDVMMAGDRRFGNARPAQAASTKTCP